VSLLQHIHIGSSGRCASCSCTFTCAVVVLVVVVVVVACILGGVVATVHSEQFRHWSTALAVT